MPMTEKQRAHLTQIKSRADYQGCRFQLSCHGAGQWSVQVFRENVLLADIDL